VRDRLRYLAVSPRPVRLPHGAGLVVGLVLAAAAPVVAILASMAATVVVHALCFAIVTVSA
jgi:hypothetical protein